MASKNVPDPDLAPLEYEKFGRVIFRFPDSEVVLRRPLLGDLEFAEDLLEELNEKTRPERDELRTEFAAVDDDQTKAGALLRRLNETRFSTNFAWLSAVFTRMAPEAKWPENRDQWPAYFFSTGLIAEIISHWTTRPLVSGSTAPPMIAPNS